MPSATQSAGEGARPLRHCWLSSSLRLMVGSGLWQRQLSQPGLQNASVVHSSPFSVLPVRPVLWAIVRESVFDSGQPSRLPLGPCEARCLVLLDMTCRCSGYSVSQPWPGRAASLARKSRHVSGNWRTARMYPVMYLSYEPLFSM